MTTKKKQQAKPTKPATNQVSAYQEALALYARGGLPYQRIVLALAQKHPSMFLDLAKTAIAADDRAVSAATPAAVGTATPTPTAPAWPHPAEEALHPVTPVVAELVRQKLGGRADLTDGLREVIGSIKADAPVPAIKRMRELFDYGLRDAKLVVDYVRCELYDEGRLIKKPSVYPFTTRLERSEQIVADTLMLIGRATLNQVRT